jgi:hypothetical protein
LRGAWVEPLVLAGKMEAPVLLEVAVADAVGANWTMAGGEGGGVQLRLCVVDRD